MEVEVTWRRVNRIWWSYLWRIIIVGFVLLFFSMCISSAVVLIIVLPLKQLGLSKTVAGNSAFVIGFVFGIISEIIAAVIALKWTLRKDFGEFRIVLVAKKNDKEPYENVTEPSLS